MPVSTESLLNALKRMREASTPRGFRQSVDLAINLEGVDPKRSDARISEEVILPHGAGRPRRVAIFAEGELARLAREAGADLVLGRRDIDSLGGDKKLAKRVAEEYDFFLAQAELMPLVGRRLGPVLGPRGKIPKPIPSTADPKPAIERYRRSVRLRMRDQPTLHTTIGNEGMADEELAANARAVVEAVERRLEGGRGRIGSVFIKTTMGEPVEVGRGGRRG